MATGGEDHRDDADGGADDEEIPSFKREAAATLSKPEREITERAANEAVNAAKNNPVMPDDAQRSAQHCSHGSHGSHGSW